MENNFDLNDFLNDREERVNLQLSLIKEYNCTLLAIRCNTPGINKNIFPSGEIVAAVESEFSTFLGHLIENKQTLHTLEGVIYLISINLPPLQLKKITVNFEENHILGRLVDLDVYDLDGNSLSRSLLNFGKRKCYICNNDAVICSRNITHSLEEILNFMRERYLKYLDEKNTIEKKSHEISNIAIRSMILEASATPSFGLVSPKISGSHKDMNFFTFLFSSFALSEYLKTLSKISMNHWDLKLVFNLSRELGKKAEIEMFNTTHNINTHKGMIFLLGITVISISREIYLKDKSIDTRYEKENILEKVSSNIQYFTETLLEDFHLINEKIKENQPLTNGEKLYLKHGFRGLRGTVTSGLVEVFHVSLPYYLNEFKKLDSEFKEYSPIEKKLHSVEYFKKCNEIYVKTLLLLISEVDDSTVVNRGDFNTLSYVKDCAKKLFSDYSLEAANILEEEFITRNISPGGSADLLAVTIFLGNLIKDI